MCTGCLYSMARMHAHTHIFHIPGRHQYLCSTCRPYLLIEYTPESLGARLQELRQQLPGVQVEALVAQEPQVLRVNIDAVLANIRRILPQSDPVQVG